MVTLMLSVFLVGTVETDSIVGADARDNVLHVGVVFVALILT